MAEWERELCVPMADWDQPPIPDRSVEQKYLLRRNRQISPEVRVTYFLHPPLLPVMVACFRSRAVDMENMDRMDAATRRALLFMLLDSDSSDSDTSSKSSDDSTDTDSECDAAVCQRAFDVMFRLPAKRPKVIGFVEDVVRRYSDDEVPYSPRWYKRANTCDARTKYQKENKPRECWDDAHEWMDAISTSFEAMWWAGPPSCCSPLYFTSSSAPSQFISVY